MTTNKVNQDCMEKAFAEIVNRLKIEVRPRITHRDKLERQVLDEYEAAGEKHGGNVPHARKSIPQIRTNWVEKTIVMKNIYKVAAAILMVAMITLIYISTGSVLGDNVSWANVCEQIRTVKTMSYMWSRERVIDPGTESEKIFVRLSCNVFVKDPGKMRREVLGSTQEVEDVVISIRSENQNICISYSMNNSNEYQQWRWMYANSIVEYELDNQTVLMWNTLKNITSDQAQKIGKKKIDGRETVGFKAVLKEKEGALRIPSEGMVVIWVDQETAVPIKAVAEFRDTREYDEKEVYERYIWQNIQWNVPLAEELFQAPAGWKAIEFENKSVKFSRTQLKDNVTVRVGPRGGAPILTEKDIAQIPSGDIFLTGKGINEKPRIIINFHLNEAGSEKLFNYTGKHINEKLLIDFNGEIIYEPTIKSQIRWGFIINLCESEILGNSEMSLEDFEEKYLRKKDCR